MSAVLGRLRLLLRPGAVVRAGVAAVLNGLAVLSVGAAALDRGRGGTLGRTSISSGRLAAADRPDPACATT